MPSSIDRFPTEPTEREILRTDEWRRLPIDEMYRRAERAARLLLSYITQLAASSDLGEVEAHILLGDEGWTEEDDDEEETEE